MIKFIFLFMCVIALTSCMQTIRPASERTIILNGEKYTEKTPGEFLSWRCNDYVHRGKTIIEVGLTSTVFKSVSGYVLYDGTNEGTIAFYQRNGLNHRWSWGANAVYSFVIKPDGTGAYYDFSYADEGEQIKPNDIFKCSKY